MTVTEKATITIEEWRKQINYKRTDGWRVVGERGDDKIAIEKDTRTRDDNREMTMRDRHDHYRERVHVDKDYTYLHKRAIPKSLTQTDYDEKVFKTGHDRRKQHLPESIEQVTPNSLTRRAKYDEYEY